MMTVETDPRDMLVLAAVVREGGFTQAARALRMSKQRVSLRVSALEEALGVRLLERTTRSLRPTDVGERYVQRCLAMAQEMDAANQEARQAQEEPSGLLRVSAPYLYGRRFLGPVVAAFMQQWPRVSVDLQLSNRRVDLVEDGFDVAVRVGHLEDSTLVARSLGHAQVHCVASPAYVRRVGRVTARHVPSLRCLGMHARETWHLQGTAVRVTPALVVNDLELLCDAAVAGMGVAQLPSLVCGAALASGALVELLPGGGAVPVFALTASRRLVAPKVRLFVDALATLAGVLTPSPEPVASRRKRTRTR